MKRIVTTLKEKWPEYLIEAVVIVASILGAISLENWNEDKKEQKIERYYLENLQADMQMQLDEIEHQREIEHILNGCIDRLVSLIDSDFKNLNEEQFNQDLTSLTLGRRFNFYDATYADLKSSGNVNLIQSVELRRALIAYYQKNERTEEIFQDSGYDHTRFLTEDLHRKGLFSFKLPEAPNEPISTKHFNEEVSQRFNHEAVLNIQEGYNLLLLGNAIRGRSTILRISDEFLKEIEQSTIELMTLIATYLDE
ncbi:MAG: DUF6090 family protein [Cyclobacteriaceae bacterium]